MSGQQPPTRAPNTGANRLSPRPKESGARTDHARHTQGEWQHALSNLKRSGQQLVGPCPLCGGKDRFWVTAEGRAFCRQCLPDGSDTARFKELIAAVFGSAVPRPANAQTHQRRPARARSRSKTGTRSIARKLWHASISADGTQARAYLAGRMAWPPDGTGPDLPPSVRWITKECVDGTVCIPKWAAGLMLCRYEDAKGRGTAVSVEALDNQGRKGNGQRWRRTYGTRKGSTFVVNPITADTPDVRMCEGEVTALATSNLWPESAVFAAGSASLMKTAAQQIPTEIKLIIEADGDVTGRQAARSVRDARNNVEVVWRRDNEGDAADTLAQILRREVALIGGNENEALPKAWRSLQGDLV